MAKRGRKPIDYQHLDLWDGEWYVAFYRLSEGGELPIRTTQWWTRRQFDCSLAERLRMLKAMSLEEYWAYSLASIPRPPNVDQPPLAKNRLVAERRRANEIAWLEQRVDPAAIQRHQASFEIWQTIWKADTHSAAERAGRCWLAFEPESMFPPHFLARLQEFLAMRHDRRFPSSPSANDARLTHLAAGMAGACVGISPITAIHRIRTMKHAAGGPLWNENALRCDCWRCDRDREMQTFDDVVNAARAAEVP